MLACMHHLVEAYNRLRNYQDKLEAEVNVLKKRKEKEQEGKKIRERAGLDIIALRPSINNAFLDLAMVVEESRSFDSGNVGPLFALQLLIPMVEKRLSTEESVEDLLETIKLLTDPLKDWISQKRHESLSYYEYRYDFKNVWNQYNSSKAVISFSAIQRLRDSIQWRKGDNNVFEVFCRDSDFSTIMYNVSGDSKNINIYGHDTFKNLKYSRKDSFKRIIYGDFKKCNISKECFDIIFVSPPMTFNRELSAKNYTRYEKDYLVKSYDYLRPGGTVIFVIPYFRFYAEICAHFARNYQNLQLFKDGDESIAVIAIAEKREVPLTPSCADVEIYKTLRKIPLTANKIPLLLDKLEKPIVLPEKSVPIQRFRGSEFSEEEFVELHKNSTCTATFWKEQQAEKLGDSHARPLLPFNIGQLGLILTSGCLDGIIDEGDGCYHVVKGRVIKKNEKIESMDNHTHQIQVTDTTSNRVEISAFLPNGTYKVLA